MDRNFKVTHGFAHNSTELEKMCGTYYVQSDIRHIYPQVKQQLKKGKIVLFVGTPCQVHGLNLYLGRNDKGNLICCDLICHGGGSPKVFDRFIDYLREKGDLRKFAFRDKSIGWAGYNVSAIINEKKYSNRLWLQTYNKLFSHNMINRKCCSRCMYANISRPGDITIGDYWGVKKHYGKFADNLGVSLVIVNSVKGKRVFNDLKFPHCIEIKKDEYIQNSLLKPNRIAKSRTDVFRDLDKYGYKYIAQKYGEYNIFGFLKNILRKFCS